MIENEFIGKKSTNFKDLKKSKWYSFLYGICTFGIFSSPFLFKFKNINFKFAYLGLFFTISIYILTYILLLLSNIDTIEYKVYQLLMVLLVISPIIFILIFRHYSNKSLNKLLEEDKNV